MGSYYGLLHFTYGNLNRRGNLLFTSPPSTASSAARKPKRTLPTNQLVHRTRRSTLIIHRKLTQATHIHSTINPRIRNLSSRPSIRRAIPSPIKQKLSISPPIILEMPYQFIKFEYQYRLGSQLIRPMSCRAPVKDIAPFCLAAGIVADDTVVGLKLCPVHDFPRTREIGVLLHEFRGHVCVQTSGKIKSSAFNIGGYGGDLSCSKAAFIGKGLEYIHIRHDFFQCVT